MELVERVGYVGFRKKKIMDNLNNQYGYNNWSIKWKWGDEFLERGQALAKYEEGYYQYFLNNPEKLDSLLSKASDVYDISKSDVNSVLDYSVQKQRASHLQDIAIRRSALRLGKYFQGDHLVEVRGRNSEGFEYNPGQVPFYKPEIINQPHLDGWWEPSSIEDFYQSNKFLFANIKNK